MAPPGRGVRKRAYARCVPCQARSLRRHSKTVDLVVDGDGDRSQGTVEFSRRWRGRLPSSPRSRRASEVPRRRSRRRGMLVSALAGGVVAAVLDGLGRIRCRAAASSCACSRCPASSRPRRAAFGLAASARARRRDRRPPGAAPAKRSRRDTSRYVDRPGSRRRHRAAERRGLELARAGRTGGPRRTSGPPAQRRGTMPRSGRPSPARRRAGSARGSAASAARLPANGSDAAGRRPAAESRRQPDAWQRASAIGAPRSRITRPVATSSRRASRAAPPRRRARARRATRSVEGKSRSTREGGTVGSSLQIARASCVGRDGQQRVAARHASRSSASTARHRAVARRCLDDDAVDGEHARARSIQ